MRGPDCSCAGSRVRSRWTRRTTSASRRTRPPVATGQRRSMQGRSTISICRSSRRWAPHRPAPHSPRRTAPHASLEQCLPHLSPARAVVRGGLFACFLPRFSCLVPRASCLLPLVSCLLLVHLVSCLVPLVSCLVPLVSCLLLVHLVSCLVPRASCLMYRTRFLVASHTAGR